jgi:mRNA-degrading endonuclease toxin of MazEF toxin-antitoxin module
MNWSRGDVVLVAVDFTDRSGTKLRPAVVSSSDASNASSPDVLIAATTGNQLAAWQAAGLLRSSLAQTTIATVAASIVRRRLGALSDVDLAGLDQGLREALALT